MPQQSDEYAVAGANFFAVAAFTDDDDVAVTPSAASWSLFDEDGDIVNEREDVVITGLASSKAIALTPADTTLIDSTSASEKRYLVVSFIYDSNRGSDLTGIDSLVFKIVNPKSG